MDIVVVTGAMRNQDTSRRVEMRNPNEKELAFLIGVSDNSRKGK